MKNNNFKYIIFIVIIGTFFLLFLINIFLWNRDVSLNTKQVEDNIKTVKTYNYGTLDSVEASLNEAEENNPSSTHDYSKGYTSADYKRIFNNSVVVGDSITEGFLAYDFLTEQEVFSKIGASIINGDSLFSSAAEVKPAKAFFAFGINDIGNYSGNAHLFKKDYISHIQSFKKTSPNTDIFINTIISPSEETLKERPELKDYKKFNKAIEEIAREESINLLETEKILDGDTSLYAEDGIHMKAEFYPLWLNSLILKAGLK